MELQEIKTVIFCIITLICILSFSFTLVIALHYHPEKTVVRTYQRIKNRLQEQQVSWFDYHKMDLFLQKHGASFHLTKKINPIQYLVINLVMAALGVLLGVRIHLMLAVILAIVGFLIPKMYLIYANNKDNIKLLPEIKLLFHALQIQIKAGVYVTDALIECYSRVKNKRLRNALMDLSSDIIIKSDFREALGRFQEKFDNRYIDSLCIIMLQAMESGQAVDLLVDISEQIKDMESIVLIKKKGELDRKVTLYLMGIMASILAVVIYACISEIFASALLF